MKTKPRKSSLEPAGRARVDSVLHLRAAGGLKPSGQQISNLLLVAIVPTNMFANFTRSLLAELDDLFLGSARICCN